MISKQYKKGGEMMMVIAVAIWLLLDVFGHMTGHGRD